MSLYWVDEDDENNPKSLLEAVLGNSHHMYSSVGHRFEIVKKDTGDVVDSFVVNEGGEGGKYIFAVGPNRVAVEKIPAKIENHFPYPVSLYWIDHEDEARPRFVLEELLGNVYEVETMPGHQFEVLKVDTGEVVASFQVSESDRDHEIVISVGPMNEEPQDGEVAEGPTVKDVHNGDLTTDNDEL